MENLNNISNIPAQPKPKVNIYKYLFFTSLFILVLIIIFLIFILKTTNLKTPSIKLENLTVTPNEVINKITPTISESANTTKTKIRAYSYKYDSNTETSAKSFPSLTSGGSMEQMYVDLILEEEDVSSFGMGVIKNFILNVFNKQEFNTYTGSYNEENGKVILFFEHSDLNNYIMPETLTFKISENNVIIDGAELKRNDGLVKVYGYSAIVDGQTQSFPSFNDDNQTYARLILVSQPEIPKDWFPGIYLFSVFNKQEKQLYSGQYSLKSDKLTLRFYDENKKEIVTSIKDNSIILDKVELKLIN